MLNTLSLYQIDALKQLTGFRHKFYEQGIYVPLRKTSKETIQKFIDIFCQHNFADTDYSVIQQEILESDSIDQWINTASLPAILKCFTYFIWTDKILDGYFETRIKNRSIGKLLQRLEAVLLQEHIPA
ncbi:MAG TPA: DUF6508 domain-containing protein [Chitinophagaceae bacterium]|jgi:hypothetical protein|nr:DUF6508 domain-containing protein [Chitinophagaceae bacterium]